MIKAYHFKLGDRTYDAVVNLNVIEELGRMAGPNEDGTPLDVHTILRIWSTEYGLMKALPVLLREGERLAGRECDIDEKWLMENLTPGEGRWVQIKLSGILVEAMKMETAMDEDQEVDEVLEAIKKKVTTESSQSGS